MGGDVKYHTPEKPHPYFGRATPVPVTHKADSSAMPIFELLPGVTSAEEWQKGNCKSAVAWGVLDVATTASMLIPGAGEGAEAATAAAKAARLVKIAADAAKATEETGKGAEVTKTAVDAAKEIKDIASNSSNVIHEATSVRTENGVKRTAKGFADNNENLSSGVGAPQADAGGIGKAPKISKAEAKKLESEAAYERASGLIDKQARKMLGIDPLGPIPKDSAQAYGEMTGPQLNQARNDYLAPKANLKIFGFDLGFKSGALATFGVMVAGGIGYASTTDKGVGGFMHQFGLPEWLFIEPWTPTNWQNQWLAERTKITTVGDKAIPLPEGNQLTPVPTPVTTPATRPDIDPNSSTISADPWARFKGKISFEAGTEASSVNEEKLVQPAILKDAPKPQNPSKANMQIKALNI